MNPGIRNDNPQYIVRLIGKVVTVSLRTVEILTEMSHYSQSNQE